MYVCIYVYGFPGGARGKKKSPCQCSRGKRHEFKPWGGRIPWSRKGQPFLYYCLENSMDREACLATVHRVEQSIYAYIYMLSIYILNICVCVCVCVCVSGQFISLPWLLHNKNLKGLKQQTSYSSVQLKQTDLLLDRHSQHMAAGRPQRSHPPHSFWLPPLYTSLFSFWLRPVQNRACTHHQSMKGNVNRHTLKAN